MSGTEAQKPRTYTFGQLVIALLAVLMVVAAVAFGSLFAYVRGQALSDMARQDARRTSQMAFETLYAAMRRGWSQQDIREIIERLNRIDPGMRIGVYRGWPVIRQYGEIAGEAERRARDPALQRTLNGGPEQLLVSDDQIRFIVPVLVQRECLGCHRTASVGDVNGVIDVSFPVRDVKVSLRFVTVAVFGTIGVLLTLLFVVLYAVLRRQVAAPVAHMNEVIREVTHSTDLTRQVSPPEHIRELREMAANFNELLGALNTYNEQLREHSIRDPLTGLHNRRKFESFLEFEVARTRRSRGEFSLLMIDLDNFKYINDTFGHPVGDLALKELGRLIGTQLRATDMAARLGGDEFAVIMPDTGFANGLQVAEKLRDMIVRTDLQLPVGNLRIQASVGVVAYPANGETAQDLFTAMDVAMYKAKREGKNRVSTIESDEHTTMMEVFNQGQRLRHALEEDRLVVALQPIMRVGTGELFAYEVLARIREEDQLLEARAFIEVAYQIGLIEEIDQRVFAKALAVKRHHGGMPGVRFFFNLSSRTFSSETRMRAFLVQVEESGLPPEEVVFEITEREALPHISRLRRLTQEFQRRGFQFALDDFGSGFSSFLYLKYLHVDYVKIEGNFIRNLTRDLRDRVMVEHIHSIARRFGLRTIAEFVEDADTDTLLRSIGIDFGQGHFYGRPSAELALIGAEPGG